MSKSDVLIRPANSWDDYVAAEEIQRVVWQSKYTSVVVPASLLKATHSGGGLLLGAYIHDRMVGFVFGFVGLEIMKGAVEKIKHCSHMLAVLPEYRSQKIAEHLKFKQREYVLAQDIDLITWTFDPLQAVNANLNLSRLGAVVRRYIPNAYGEMSDLINAGLPTDRFEAEWWIETLRVKERVSSKPKVLEWGSLMELEANQVFEISIDSQNLPHIEQQNDLSGDLVLVEIPSDINLMKAKVPVLANEWRMSTRDIFQRCFAAGYTVFDFFIISTQKERVRAAYLLTRKETGISDFDKNM